MSLGNGIFEVSNPHWDKKKPTQFWGEDLSYSLQVFRLSYTVAQISRLLAFLGRLYIQFNQETFPHQDFIKTEKFQQKASVLTELVLSHNYFVHISCLGFWDYGRTLWEESTNPTVQVSVSKVCCSGWSQTRLAKAPLSSELCCTNYRCSAAPGELTWLRSSCHVTDTKGDQSPWKAQ